MERSVTASMTATDLPEVVLFLGFQKTGTTFVHQLLNDNRALLPPDLEVRAYGDATWDLRLAGTDYTHWPTVGRLEHLAEVIEDQARQFREGGAARLVISDENVIGRQAYNANGHMLDWAKRFLPMLERGFAGYRLLFYFHTRAPGGWLRSYYNQSVRRTRLTERFEDWAAGVGPVDWADWRRQLQAHVVSPVEFRAMENDLAEHGFPGATLLDRLGVDRAVWPRLTLPAPQNPSLSDRQLAILRRINAVPLLRGQAHAIGDYFERTGTK